MKNIKQLFSSTEHYTQAFKTGLTNILEMKSAGTFILACANYFQHPELLEKNNTRLRDIFKAIEEHYQICRNKNQRPDDSTDDITVMNKIIEIGFNSLKPLQTRSINYGATSFQLSFNQLRSFRPARMSQVKDINLNTPFNETGFHFDKAFLEKEIFSEGKYQNHQVSLLYNKFPFVKYHALLVVDKEKHHSQYLTKETLEYITKLQSDTQKNIHNFVLTYNSLGAGASVNHLHFQTFLEAEPLAVFSPKLVHNGGPEPYPATCLVFNDIEKCWDQIENLHATNIPYNLLFKDNIIFCLPRRFADDSSTGFNVSTYGWAEMAGLFTINNEDVFRNTTVDKLVDSIKSITKYS